MQYISDFAAGFMKLFLTGGKTFISWMSNIVPVVLLLLVLMNTIIAFIGEERIERFAQKASRNVLMRYLVLPFLAAFMLGNPMCFTLARFLPEYYKPSYYAAQAQFCHTSNGVFPHINPGELFVWLGIAQGGAKTRTESNGSGYSLYVSRDCHELYRWLDYRLHDCLCFQANWHYPEQNR